MVISAQVSLDASNSSSNLLSKSSNALSSTTSNKASKEVSSMVDRSKSNSKTSNKKDDFKDVLNSSKNTDDKQSEKITNDMKNIDKTESTAIKELKDKIQELKEKFEENSGDEKEVNDIIESLLNALNALLGIDDKSKDKSQGSTEFIDIIVENVMDGSSKGADSVSLLNQLLELLSSEDAKSSLDSETLTGMKDLLTQLQVQIADDSKVSDKMKSGINDIISKLTEMINEAKSNGDKVLSLEDMLKNGNGYSQEDNSSLANSSDESSETFSSSKDTSKEDKFLNSLLDDKKDNSVDNKINMFASRTQSVQGQNTVQRGLTVNKATFTQDLIKDVKYMSTNGLKELTVKVNPGNLGEITIRLIQEDGLMKANLKANSKETTALLAQNLAEIKKELGDQNIKISEVNIELYNDDTTYFKDGSFGGALSQEQGREESKRFSATDSRNDVNLQDDEIIENNAEIDTTLDFLA